MKTITITLTVEDAQALTHDLDNLAADYQNNADTSIWPDADSTDADRCRRLAALIQDELITVGA